MTRFGWDSNRLLTRWKCLIMQEQWINCQPINHQPSINYQSTNHQANFANLAPGCTATQPLQDQQLQGAVAPPAPWRQKQNSTPPPPSRIVPKPPSCPPPWATQQQVKQLQQKQQGEVHINFHSPAASSGPHVYTTYIYTIHYIYTYISF